MDYWWVTFTDGTAGCVAAPSDDDARRLAAGTGKPVYRAAILPYPASPRLLGYQVAEFSFPFECFHPETCQGRTSCPRGRIAPGMSCSE